MADVAAVSDRKKQILVVDDDWSVREMLVRVLREDYHLAVPAANGEEALKIADAIRFDLVLLDLGMPGKDGWETFSDLVRRHPGLAVIVITAKPNQRAAALAAGAGAFFEKPLVFADLLQAVRRLLSEWPTLQK